MLSIQNNSTGDVWAKKIDLHSTFGVTIVQRGRLFCTFSRTYSPSPIVVDGNTERVCQLRDQNLSQPSGQHLYEILLSTYEVMGINPPVSAGEWPRKNRLQEDQ